MKILLHQHWEDVRSLSERWNYLLEASASNTATTAEVELDRIGAMGA